MAQFSNGQNSYSLADFNNATASAMSVQVAADNQVADLAKQVAQMNITEINQQSAAAQKLLAPFIQMGQQGAQQLQSYITNGQAANKAMNNLLGVSSGPSSNPELYSQANSDLAGDKNTMNTNPQGSANWTAASNQMAQNGDPNSPDGMWNQTDWQKQWDSTNGGQAGQMGALNNMLNSPMIQSQLQFGLEGVNNQLSAQGLTGSGGAMKQLQSYGQGLASNQIGNYMSALQGQSAQGMSAASSEVQAGGTAAGLGAQGLMSAGAQVAQQNNQMATTQSNAILNSGQVEANGILSMAQMSLMAAMQGGGGGGMSFG